MSLPNFSLNASMVSLVVWPMKLLLTIFSGDILKKRVYINKLETGKFEGQHKTRDMCHKFCSATFRDEVNF